MHHGGIEKELVSFIEKSVKGVLFDLKKPAARSREIIPELEIPKERTHGDISTNIAMKASRLVSMPPMRFAISIWDKMNAALPSSPIKNDIEKIEVKNPGFINFFLSSSHLYKVLLAIQREKHNYGRSSIYRGKTMQIEFVSANPTGPLTIAHGRQAAIGDSLARILSFLSCAVKREYYIND